MVNTDDCMLYAGPLSNQGYGAVRYYYKGTHINSRVHRLVYERFVGEIPEGLVLDHLCRVRHCINPNHLEPVTVKENNLRGISPMAQNARKTVCIKGHKYEGNNLWKKNGARYCRECQNEYNRGYYQRNKAKWLEYNS